MVMKNVLVEQLYNEANSKALQELFKTDPSSRSLIKHAIGTKLITDQNAIITSNAIDTLFLVCLTAKFADSEDECNRVAISIYQYYDKTNDMLPSLMSDRDLKFASKTLIALSFRPQALEKRWKYHGAPSPNFYRQLSKTIYSIWNQKDISAHHEQWEAFLGEILI